MKVCVPPVNSAFSVPLMNHNRRWFMVFTSSTDSVTHYSQCALARQNAFYFFLYRTVGPATSYFKAQTELAAFSLHSPDFLAAGRLFVVYTEYSIYKRTPMTFCFGMNLEQ